MSGQAFPTSNVMAQDQPEFKYPPRDQTPFELVPAELKTNTPDQTMVTRRGVVIPINKRDFFVVPPEKTELVITRTEVYNPRTNQGDYIEGLSEMLLQSAGKAGSTFKDGNIMKAHTGKIMSDIVRRYTTELYEIYQKIWSEFRGSANEVTLEIASWVKDDSKMSLPVLLTTQTSEPTYLQVLYPNHVNDGINILGGSIEHLKSLIQLAAAVQGHKQGSMNQLMMTLLQCRMINMKFEPIFSDLVSAEGQFNDLQHKDLIEKVDPFMLEIETLIALTTYTRSQLEEACRGVSTTRVVSAHTASQVERIFSFWYPAQSMLCTVLFHYLAENIVTAHMRSRRALKTLLGADFENFHRMVWTPRDKSQDRGRDTTFRGPGKGNNGRNGRNNSVASSRNSSATRGPRNQSMDRGQPRNKGGNKGGNKLNRRQSVDFNNAGAVVNNGGRNPRGGEGAAKNKNAPAGFGLKRQGTA